MLLFVLFFCLASETTVDCVMRCRPPERENVSLATMAALLPFPSFFPFYCVVCLIALSIFVFQFDIHILGGCCFGNTDTYVGIIIDFRLEVIPLGRARESDY